MPHRRPLAVRLLVMALLLYALLLGATFNGVINLTITRASLVMLTVGVIGWLFVHYRQGRRWHPTPLDGAILAAGAAVLIATLPNLDSWRRIAIGLWYLGLYLGIWMILADLIANGLPARWLVDGILVTGIPVFLFGYVQLQGWLGEWLRLLMAGIPVPFTPPRPSSIIGNPNALGSVLVVMIPLALGRMFQTRRWSERIGWVVYLLAGAGLLFLTLSRGAWLGLLTALGVLIVLALLWRGLVSWGAWQDWWHGLCRTRQILAVAVLVGLIATGGLSLALAWDALNMGGRSVETREIIWDAAWTEFTAHLLSGTGPFTFGKDLLAHQSTPPRTAHSHAHNLPLHIAAEAGLPGIAALLWGGGAIVVAWWKRWRGVRTVSAEAAEIAAAGAALAGFAVHHLFDLPLMMPAVALLGILLLAVITVLPGAREAPSQRWRGATVMALWTVLLAAGWWSFAVKSAYLDALLMASRGDLRQGADALAAVIAQDPAMPLYHAQQGYVLGVAAARGDATALPGAIAAWDRALALEAGYAPWWANRAALRFQAGDVAGAINDLQAAVERAPESAFLWLNLGYLYEINGDDAAARDAYAGALRLSPAWAEDSFVLETQVRRDALEMFRTAYGMPRFVSDEALALLQAGDADAARDLLLSDAGTAAPYASQRVILALACERSGAQTQADLWMASAHLYPTTPADEAWIAVGDALLATLRSQPNAPDRIATAQAYFAVGAWGSSFPNGPNLAWFHFLREAFPDQFLPQLMVLPGDPRAGQLLAVMSGF